ncbi:MAG: Asp-tRNA(Asn)/Glu-tRNA(Gln) amidotransferase subunit GatC [Rickettsiales bacterium]|nr:Asp-tRNA(Asn)/Glu-tRNA(Gln) amidotransferase subunit GatC [Rickettsiales bacterium]
MINREELINIERLSRISFSDKERDSFTQKLENVIAMINQVQDIECQNVEPLRSVCEMNQRLQEDEVKIGDISDELFKNTPGKTAEFSKEIKCFVVPKVVE